jgi:hypothetical protein
MTLQQINLYQPVKLGVAGSLTARHATMLLLALVFTLVSVSAVMHWQVHRLQMTVNGAQNSRAAQSAAAAQRPNALAGLSQEQLDATLLELGAQVQGKSQALAQLQADSREPAAFAERVSALARRHVDGVWLERLALGPGSKAMSLTGLTYTVDAVPRYLQSLSADPVLKGSRIDEFVIERPAQDEQAPPPPPGALRFRAANQRTLAMTVADSTVTAERAP